MRAPTVGRAAAAAGRYGTPVAATPGLKQRRLCAAAAADVVMRTRGRRVRGTEGGITGRADWA
jgi:hypothetical protein